MREQIIKHTKKFLKTFKILEEEKMNFKTFGGGEVARVLSSSTKAQTDTKWLGRRLRNSNPSKNYASIWLHSPHIKQGEEGK